MIQRELYMKKVRPFIDKDIIKVMTGIRRCGKSVMLKLIQQELFSMGRTKEQIFSLNFESQLLPFSRNIDAASIYLQSILQNTSSKMYFFLMKCRNCPVGKS